MCGNVLLIALDELAEEGLIDKSDLPEPIPVTTAIFDQVSPPQALNNSVLSHPSLASLLLARQRGLASSLSLQGRAR